MGYIGPAAAYQAIVQADQSDWDPVIMTAIAGAESTWDTDAISPTDDYGLLQINRYYWGSLFATHPWNQAVPNAEMAFVVWNDQGYGAWSTYNSGAYRKYMSTAESVAGGGGGGGGGGTYIDTPAQPSAGNYQSSPLITGSADLLRSANRNLVRWGNAIADVPALGGF